MAVEPSRAELEAAHCWLTDDHVPKRPEMTAYRRRMRLHQARWREAHGHPIGSQPLIPQTGKPSQPVGNRLPVDYARTTGATFLTSAAHDAATFRLSATAKEPHQSLDAQRTWSDLLWPTAFSFNLFGELAAKPERLARYAEVTELSGEFGTGWLDAVNATELIHIWLEHLLLNSMLQHPGGEWRWGRYVVVHPAGNPDFAGACATYRRLLADGSTFASTTAEDLLRGDVLPAAMVSAFRQRYLPEPDE